MRSVAIQERTEPKLGNKQMSSQEHLTARWVERVRQTEGHLFQRHFSPLFVCHEYSIVHSLSDGYPTEMETYFCAMDFALEKQMMNSKILLRQPAVEQALWVFEFA